MSPKGGRRCSSHPAAAGNRVAGEAITSLGKALQEAGFYDLPDAAIPVEHGITLLRLATEAAHETGSRSLTGASVEAAIATATPLVDPRLSEVDWDLVAALLTPDEAAQEAPAPEGLRLARAIHEGRITVKAHGDFTDRCICNEIARDILRGMDGLVPKPNIEKVIAEYAPPAETVFDPWFEVDCTQVCGWKPAGTTEDEARRHAEETGHETARIRHESRHYRRPTA